MTAMPRLISIKIVMWKFLRGGLQLFKGLRLFQTLVYITFAPADFKVLSNIVTRGFFYRTDCILTHALFKRDF